MHSDVWLILLLPTKFHSYAAFARSLRNASMTVKRLVAACRRCMLVLDDRYCPFVDDAAKKTSSYRYDDTKALFCSPHYMQKSHSVGNIKSIELVGRDEHSNSEKPSQSQTQYVQAHQQRCRLPVSPCKIKHQNSPIQASGQANTVLDNNQRPQSHKGHTDAG